VHCGKERRRDEGKNQGIGERITINRSQNTFRREGRTRMFTFNFRCVLSALLISVTAVTLLLPTVSNAQTQPVTVTITEVWDIEGDMDGVVFPSPGDLYAVAIINGTKLNTFDDRFSFPGEPGTGFITPFGPLIPDPLWVMTQEVPSASGVVPVLIQIWDSDDNIFDDDDDQGDINPIPGSFTLVLDVNLTTGKWSGDVNWPQSCVEGIGDDRPVRVCFDISVLSASGDADEDGLLDSWEQNGFNADGDGTIDVNLPAFGANPRRKDVFVEVDCLVATNHSHCPRPDAISDAVQSFANAPVANLDGTTGVQLHVDVGSLFGAGVTSVPGTRGVAGTYGNFGGGGTQIAEAGNEIIESFNSPKGSATKFATLREAFFDSRRDLLFRYAIFGHQTNARQAMNDCTSGEVNTIPGNEFFVTLGGVLTGTFPCWTPDANGFAVGSRTEQAGTFMHELGHALGLLHGGDQNANDKPNYLSVMNYTFQDCSVTPSPNGFLPGGCDYSRIALPPLVAASLDEIKLDECIGIDAGQLGFGPVNWDGDAPVVLEGKTCPPPNTTNVQEDINGDGRLDILTGFDDWKNLAFSLVAIASGGGGSLPVEDEADPETIRESREFMGTLLAPGVVVDKTGPATAKPGDLLTYTTQIRNQGHGPALQAVFTDTRPNGGTQVENLGAVVIGGLVTRTSNFTVPLTACPGDFTSASAAVTFKDFVSNQLTASDSAPLEILDVAPPTLAVTVSPAILWSPNHDFRNITATITVTDNCDPNPTVTLVSVVSNEPETGFLGTGDKGPDVQGAAVGTDDRAFSVRAERGTGGQSTGRVYTITYRATDRSGNTRDVMATVTVPTSSS
jgi:uncharacterized repeat protein (TIGR01451 family)